MPLGLLFTHYSDAMEADLRSDWTPIVDNLNRRCFQQRGGSQVITVHQFARILWDQYEREFKCTDVAIRAAYELWDHWNQNDQQPATADVINLPVKYRAPPPTVPATQQADGSWIFECSYCRAGHQHETLGDVAADDVGCWQGGPSAYRKRSPYKHRGYVLAAADA